MSERPDLTQLPRARASVAGHFGEWLQGRLSADGALVLVTVTCDALRVRAQRFDADGFSVKQPKPQVLATDAAEGFARRMRLRPARYVLDIDMVAGGGAGASTAALVALARAGGAQDDAAIAAACLACEGATDPLMMAAPDTLLWASRKAQIAGRVPAPPRAEIWGGFWGKPQRTAPKDQRFPEIADLVARWQTGPDLAEAAELASESARRTTALRGPDNDPTEDLAKRLGALGWLRAHTGSARGVIFAPGTAPDEAEIALKDAGFAGVLRFQTGGRA